VSTSAAGEATRGGRAWRRVLIVASVVAGGVGTLVAGTADRGPLRLAGLLIALAALGVLLAVWEVRERAERDREHAERRELRDREEQLAELQTAVAAREATLASLGDGVVLFTPDGRAAYANPAVKELLGRRFETITELVPSALRSAVQETMTSQQQVARELSVAERVVQAIALPSSPPGSVVLLVRDVTQPRRVEQLRRDFVANASHELKTPVASMLALSETLASATDDPAALTNFLGRLQQEASRLASLVQDLLALSRLEGGPLEHRPVRLDLVVAGEADRLRPRAGEVGLRLVLEASDQVVVAGAESDLGLMVHNLLDNAIRYTPAGGGVRLSVSAQDGNAILRVDDTGIGIPSRDLDRVFERFYRVDDARSRETGGTGLGLSIVRHVAESHGGTAAVRSVLGAGSTFTVELPLVTAAE
jgi:two-component system phosphate regulon sensor histidine kinase PhoR